MPIKYVNSFVQKSYSTNMERFAQYSLSILYVQKFVAKMLLVERYKQPCQYRTNNVVRNTVQRRK